MFEVYTMLITCNLAYLKIEKYRQLREFKKAKEASWAVYLRVRDCKARLLNATGGQISGSTAEMSEFFELGQFFYQILAYYFMLI